jgi:hypothetical protein
MHINSCFIWITNPCNRRSLNIHIEIVDIRFSSNHSNKRKFHRPFFFCIRKNKQKGNNILDTFYPLASIFFEFYKDVDLANIKMPKSLTKKKENVKSPIWLIEFLLLLSRKKKKKKENFTRFYH